LAALAETGSTLCPSGQIPVAMKVPKGIPPLEPSGNASAYLINGGLQLSTAARDQRNGHKLVQP
jgi:hypothetical protein